MIRPQDDDHILAPVAYFLGRILLGVICTIVAAIVITVIARALWEEPTIVQEISVGVIVCAGALWTMILSNLLGR